MAISFNETDDAYTIASTAWKTFPNGQWSMWVWTRVSDNTGSAYQYITSNQNIGAPNSLNLWLGDTGGIDPDKWSCRIVPGAGGTVNLVSTSSPGGDGANRLIVIQRTASAFEMWFCTPGGTASLEASVTLSGHTDVVSGMDFFIGRRADSNVDRFYGGVAAGLGRSNTEALSQSTIEALALGIQPWVLGIDMLGYLPLADPATTQKNTVVRADTATATNIGDAATGFPFILAGVPCRTFGAAAPSAPPAEGLLELPSGGSTADLRSSNIGTWDDQEGTIYIDDGNSNKVAIGWDPTGFFYSLNGSTGEFDKYPIEIPDPPHTEGSGTVYYVSNSSGGSNAGTLANPFTSLTSASGTYGSNDTIKIKGGDTFTNQLLTISGSGHETNGWIKVESYGTGRPLIDLNNARDTGIVVNDNYVWIDNINIANGTDSTDGMINFLSQTGGFISNCDFDTTAGAGLVFTNSIESKAKHLTLNDCARSAVWVNHKTGAISKTPNNRFQDIVAVDCGGASGFEIFTGMNPGDAAWDIVVSGQTTNDTNVYFGWNVYAPQESTGKARFFNCTVNSGTGSLSQWTVTGKGFGMSCYRNQIYDHGTGFFAANPTNIDPATTFEPYCFNSVHHNEIYFLRQSVSTTEGGILLDRLNQYDDPGGEDPKNKVGDVSKMHVVVWNNTIDDCHNGMMIGTNWVLTDDHIYHSFNNLLTNCTYAFRLTDVFLQDFLHNYNYYYNNDNGSGQQFRKNAGGAMSDAAWLAQSWAPNFISPDADSDLSDTDPEYINPTAAIASRDYGLASTSPARGANGFVGKADLFNAKKTFSGGTLVDVPDINSVIGKNFIPQPTSPSAGANQYLFGEILDFSKEFLGLNCNGGSCAYFLLKETRDADEDLTTWTGA